MAKLNAMVLPEEQHLLSEIESCLEEIGIDGVLECVATAFSNKARELKREGDSCEVLFRKHARAVRNLK